MGLKRILSSAYDGLLGYRIVYSCMVALAWLEIVIIMLNPSEKGKHSGCQGCNIRKDKDHSLVGVKIE